MRDMEWTEASLSDVCWKTYTLAFIGTDYLVVACRDNRVYKIKHSKLIDIETGNPLGLAIARSLLKKRVDIEVSDGIIMIGNKIRTKAIGVWVSNIGYDLLVNY